MVEDRPVILLLGPDGQLGWELRRTLSTLGCLETAGRAGADHFLDLAAADALSQLVRSLRPDLVVNAAAYTAVDMAESEPELARRINAEAVGWLGEIAAESGCPVLHFSTDYVFSGAGDRPWREGDATAPLSVYGRTKLEGERLLAASGADYMILRLAWVYSTRGRNFLLTMQRLLAERDQLPVVADQIGSPSWSRQIAEASAQILAQCRKAGGGFGFEGRGGVYHLTAGGQASWYDFARAIAGGLGLACEPRPVSTAEYPTPARRPAWSVLDNGRLRQTFGVALPHWREGLALCLESFAERR